jgi:hypothetical protein
MYVAIRGRAPAEGEDRLSERGAGIVEWLGISALSIGMLVVMFGALEEIGLGVIDSIRRSLGV